MSDPRWWARFALPTLVIAKSIIVGLFREEWPAAACIPQQAAGDRPAWNAMDRKGRHALMVATAAAAAATPPRFAGAPVAGWRGRRRVGRGGRERPWPPFP